MPSEIWADFSNTKHPMCAHFAYLFHGNCSFIVSYVVDILGTISSDVLDEKMLCPITQHLELMTVSRACCQPALLFISRTLMMAKGIFWDLLKDVRVKKCHVYEVLVPCQFFNKIFSRIPVDRQGLLAVKRYFTREIANKTAAYKGRWYLFS